MGIVDESGFREQHTVGGHANEKSVLELPEWPSGATETQKHIEMVGVDEHEII
jgi:hypothetical protein